MPRAFRLDPANHQRHRLEWQGKAREWFSMPYQDGEKNHHIWGATAGMLRNMFERMYAA